MDIILDTNVDIHKLDCQHIVFQYELCLDSTLILSITQILEKLTIKQGVNHAYGTR